MSSGKTKYQKAVEWIAWNDEPTDDEPESVAQFVTTMLIADVFGKDPLTVGEDIVKYRLRTPELIGE